MRKIKVLETIRQGMVGGGETHVFDLSTHLDQEKYEPIVLSFTEGPMVDNLRAKGVKTIVIHSKIPFDPRVKKQVKQLLIDEKIDLVHAHGSRAASNVLAVSKELKLPMIYTVHGWSFNDQQSWWVKKLRTQAEKYITSKVDQVICVSSSSAETGKEAISGFSCEVVNNGISLDKFSNNQGREATRSQLGFQEGEVWVGFIARLTFQKDPINLLKAFMSASQSNTQLRMLMVGEGELEKEVEDFIKAYNLKEKVKRMPFQSNVPELLNAIDIYSLVSHWEGLPIGLLEAMASSKAIVASNVDGTKEIIHDQQNGILIANADPEMLKNALLELASDSAKRERFGDAAFETVKDRFSLDSMVVETQNLYDFVLF